MQRVGVPEKIHPGAGDREKEIEKVVTEIDQANARTIEETRESTEEGEAKERMPTPGH